MDKFIETNFFKSMDLMIEDFNHKNNPKIDDVLLSRIRFLNEYRTLGINTRRQIGKTSYIASRADENSLIVVLNKNIKQYISKLIDRKKVNESQIIVYKKMNKDIDPGSDFLNLRGHSFKHINKIYFDESEFMEGNFINNLIKFISTYSWYNEDLSKKMIIKLSSTNEK